MQLLGMLAQLTFLGGRFLPRPSSEIKRVSQV